MPSCSIMMMLSWMAGVLSPVVSRDEAASSPVIAISGFDQFQDPALESGPAHSSQTAFGEELLVLLDGVPARTALPEAVDSNLPPYGRRAGSGSVARDESARNQPGQTPICRGAQHAGHVCAGYFAMWQGAVNVQEGNRLYVRPHRARTLHHVKPAGPAFRGFVFAAMSIKAQSPSFCRAVDDGFFERAGRTACRQEYGYASMPGGPSRHARIALGTLCPSTRSHALCMRKISAFSSYSRRTLLPPGRARGAGAARPFASSARRDEQELIRALVAPSSVGSTATAVRWSSGCLTSDWPNAELLQRAAQAIVVRSVATTACGRRLRPRHPGRRARRDLA